jgi:hypothetical protein
MIRLGARLKTFREGTPQKAAGTMEKIAIKNIKVNQASQIAMLISGIPGSRIENLKISNLSVQLSGGGNAEEAKTILAEKEADYPEITMFGKTMPAYGVYIRHAKKVRLDQILLTTLKEDGRPPVVGIDVGASTFNGSKISEKLQ